MARHHNFREGTQGLYYQEMQKNTAHPDCRQRFKRSAALICFFGAIGIYSGVKKPLWMERLFLESEAGRYLFVVFRGLSSVG